VDGNLVVRGYDVFKIVESLGVPLEVVLDYFKQNNYTVDWFGFLITSVDHNWKVSSTILKIVTSVTDVYGREHGEIVETTLNRLLTGPE